MTGVRACVCGLVAVATVLAACQDTGASPHPNAAAAPGDTSMVANVAGATAAAPSGETAPPSAAPPVEPMVMAIPSTPPAMEAPMAAATPPPQEHDSMPPRSDEYSDTGIDGMGTMSALPNPSICQPAPAGTSPEAIAALALVNNFRVPAGAGCATMLPEINASATAHCAYYAMHANDIVCAGNPHLEVAGCSGFTGITPNDRLEAAGYADIGAGEVMAFDSEGDGRLYTWMNSVWPRVSLLDPWKTHLGYGNAPGCETMDFGRGAPAPESTVVVYPYDLQIDVPLAFFGPIRGPTVPAPSTGWPSSAPISLFAMNIAITEHVLTKVGDETPIDHVWLDSQTQAIAQDMRPSLLNVVFMYATAPFEANTTYRVKITGTYAGGTLTKQWTFTTRHAR